MTREERWVVHLNGKQPARAASRDVRKSEGRADIYIYIKILDQIPGLQLRQRL